jgi:hypothetical protein
VGYCKSVIVVEEQQLKSSDVSLGGSLFVMTSSMLLSCLKEILYALPSGNSGINVEHI